MPGFRDGGLPEFPDCPERLFTKSQHIHPMPVCITVMRFCKNRLCHVLKTI
jgi:hypothetical protein